MKYIKIGEKEIEYVEKPCLMAKRLAITVKNGKVTVTLPRGAAKKQVSAFIHQQREWILDNLNKQELEAAAKLGKFAEGALFQLMDEALRLRLIRANSLSTEIRRQKDELWIFLPEKYQEIEAQKAVREAVKHWYKIQAQEIFSRKLKAFAMLMGVRYQQFRVKEQASRWGSCSAKGNINLNWQVLQAPEQVIDYLIVHELAHLRYMNHSRDFWRFVEQYSPDYTSCRFWLRQHGARLMFK